ELLSFEPLQTIQGYRREIEDGGNPRDVKYKLADELVARFHGRDAANRAHERFVSRFSHGVVPEDLVCVDITVPADGVQIAALLRQAGLTRTNGEGMRLVKQGAVRVGDSKIEDASRTLAPGDEYLLRVGKRRL